MQNFNTNLFGDVDRHLFTDLDVDKSMDKQSETCNVFVCSLSGGLSIPNMIYFSMAHRFE